MKPAGGSARGVARRWTGLWADAATRGACVHKSTVFRAVARTTFLYPRATPHALPPCRQATPKGAGASGKPLPCPQACSLTKQKRPLPKKRRGRRVPGAAESPCHARRHAPCQTKKTPSQKRKRPQGSRGSEMPLSYYCMIIVCCLTSAPVRWPNRGASRSHACPVPSTVR